MRLRFGAASPEKAEGVGFEPTWGCHPMGDFKSPAITALPPLQGGDEAPALRPGLCHMRG